MFTGNLRATPWRGFSTGHAFVLVLLYFTFPVLAGAQILHTFSNPSPITINDNAAASPYPSTINVTNVPSVISKVTVTLNGFSHTFPSDVDVMLVGPGGQNAVIMSDVGAGNDAVALTLTLDDAATATLPAPLISGTFLPTNIDTASDIFPAPAPTTTGASALAIFNGTNPNGAWRLYVRDDAGIDVGSFGGGWTLTITNAISGQNTNSISIPDTGIASPYPSQIELTNLGGLVSGVQVNLINFSHSSPDDVDLVLAAPNGRTVVLMSDVGGTNPVTNLTLTFDDAALSSLPDNVLITPGPYQPTDFEPGDVFPAPAPPAAPPSRFLSSLNGSAPNGAWKLFLVDDSGANAGSISGGWSIVVRTSVDVIDIPSSGVSNPYPSTFSVTALPGNVTSAVVTLTNFSHSSPDDVDIMLVAPNGRRVVLMSDVGGTTEIGGVTLTFDDQAASPLPDNSPLVSGSYKPADFEPGDLFPAPAPSGPVTGNTLAAFYGSAPNGLWKLYIVDDSGNNLGSIAGGWSLSLQTSPGACLFDISPQIQAYPVSGGSGVISITMPAGCSWTASASVSFVTLTSAPAGDGSGTLSFTVGTNTGQARTGAIDVSNGVTVRRFQAQQASGCPLSASQSSLNFGSAGGGGNVAVTAGGGCSWQATASAPWIHITSPQQTGSGGLTFTVDPNPSATGRTSAITSGPVTIAVVQAPLRAARFDFDGDARADLSIFRPSDGVWWIERSGAPGAYGVTPFGISTDRLTPADYDGDRKADISVYRNGTWYIYLSQTNTVRYDLWGAGTDIPVPGDYDGDQKADTAIYRPSAGQWWIRRSSNSAEYTLSLGLATDKPVSGDYDGDGRADIAVYRPGATVGAASGWSILQSSNGALVTYQFGAGEDIPVVGDFDGDGRDDLAVFRPSSGTWYTSLDASINYGSVLWGMAGDTPVAADYNGDGRTDYAVFRQGIWYILHAGSTATRVEQWGVSSDKPAPAAFTP